MSSVIARPGTAAEPGPDERADASAPSLRRRSHQLLRRYGVDLVVVAVLLAWLAPLTHRFGGREPGALTLGLLLLVPAVVLTRVDTLSRRHLLALLPGAVALLAVVVGPRRGDGLDEAALWLSGGLVYLVVVAWLRRGGREAVAIAVVLVAVLDQFAVSWWAWFGQADPSALMRGTFFWHNPFAAFMVGGGLVGAVVVLLGAGRLRALGGATFVVAVAGTYYSTSRASLAILVAGSLLAVVAARHRPRRVAGFALLTAASLAFTWLISVRLLMPQGGGVSGLAARGEPLVGNGMARVAYWRGVLRVVRENPWTGTGADSFGTAGMAVVPGSPQPTTLVHNGVLQAFVDGGLPLGLAVLACVSTVMVLATRAILASIRVGVPSEAAFTVAASIGAGALVAHAMLDFDWSYPSLLVLFALLAAVVVSRSASADTVPPRPLTGLMVTAAIVLGVLASGGHDAAAATGPVPLWRTVATLGVAAPDAGVSVPSGLRPVSSCLDDLRAWTSSPSVGSAPTAPPDDLMSCTAPASVSDPWVVVARASAVARTGDLSTADAMAAPAVAAMQAQNPRFSLVPLELAVLADERAVVVTRLVEAERLIGPEAPPAVLADLDRLRLQIAADLPMTSRGTSDAAAGGRVPAVAGMGITSMGRGER